MNHRIVDLHVHSTESDGTFSPTELVTEAKRNGLSAFATTTPAQVSAKQCPAQLLPGLN